MRITTKPILFRSIGSCLVLAVLSLPLGGQTPITHQARPGSINYVDGQAMIDGQQLSPDSMGSALLEKGQTLTTQAGKVEILLTPGVFLRVAENSSAKMISPDLANTETEVDKGRAMVEVTDISKNNNIRIDENGASTQLLKKGLYDFDADHHQIRVFSGKVEVYVNNQKLSLGEDREVTLNTGGKLKPQNFDTKQYADDCVPRAQRQQNLLLECATA